MPRPVSPSSIGNSPGSTGSTPVLPGSGLDLARVPGSRGESQPEPSLLILALDGGGTKTLAVLARVDPLGAVTTLSTATAGGSNPLSCSWQSATDALATAIEGATHAALERGLISSAERPQCAVLGIAGVSDPAVRERLRRWCEDRGVAAQLHLATDVDVLLDGASSSQGGALDTLVLIAGTGSVCLGRGPSSHRAVAGGWGYLIDDDGSGYWVGQQALRACVAARDAGGVSPLEHEVLRALGVGSIDSVKGAVYTAPQPRTVIASLAQSLDRLANGTMIAAGDARPLASQILQQAGELLAERALNAARLAGVRPGHCTVTLAGGLLAGSELVRRTVLLSLEPQLQPVRVHVAGDCVSAALALASQLRLQPTGS